MSATNDELLTDCVVKTMGFDTLETRKNDSLDFRPVSRWAVREALRAAYRAGSGGKDPKGATLDQIARRWGLLDPAGRDFSDAAVWTAIIAVNAAYVEGAKRKGVQR